MNCLDLPQSFCIICLGLSQRFCFNPDELFTKIVLYVSRFAAAVRDGSQYFVLLIVTDGIVTDMPETKQAIVTVSLSQILTLTDTD